VVVANAKASCLDRPSAVVGSHREPDLYVAGACRDPVSLLDETHQERPTQPESIGLRQASIVYRARVHADDRMSAGRRREENGLANNGSSPLRGPLTSLRFGQAIVAKANVPTATIYAAHRAAETHEQIADWYELTADEVRAAIAFEESRDRRPAAA
jgi:uncharacterized protein (DUF433 family)